TVREGVSSRMKGVLFSIPFILPPSSFLLAFTPSLTVGLLPLRAANVLCSHADAFIMSRTLEPVRVSCARGRASLKALIQVFCYRAPSASETCVFTDEGEKSLVQR